MRHTRASIPPRTVGTATSARDRTAQHQAVADDATTDGSPPSTGDEVPATSRAGTARREMSASAGHTAGGARAATRKVGGAGGRSAVRVRPPDPDSRSRKPAAGAAGKRRSQVAPVDPQAGLLEQSYTSGEAAHDEAHDDDLAFDLLDALAVETDPRAQRMLDLMRERGWASWTRTRPQRLAHPPD